jgi:two-component system, LuxR family, sensor kinase FixL
MSWYGCTSLTDDLHLVAMPGLCSRNKIVTAQSLQNGFYVASGNLHVPSDLFVREAYERDTTINRAREASRSRTRLWHKAARCISYPVSWLLWNLHRIRRLEGPFMSRLESFFEYAESHRFTVCAIGGVMVAIIAWADALLPMLSIGFLYLFPIVLVAAALSSPQIVVLSGLCSFLREAYDSTHWSAGASGRLIVAGAGFAMAGFFVTGLNQRRQLLQKHVGELEAEVRLRKDAESQIRVLIETSPLAILTLNQEGRVALANESARELLEFGEPNLQGMEIAPYLPILPRMLNRHHAGGNMRTNVECKARRLGGEVFLANVWVSTYVTSEGPGLAAVIWDASENLRDRERTKLDSVLATSRVLIGAISHEIRNLASAADACHAALAPPQGTVRSGEHEALGSLIRALESIANSGLRMASQREPAVADLGTILDEARIVIEPMLREAGFEVTWNVQENLPLVQSEQNSLLQVFVNLARNVVEHASQGPGLDVNISTDVENDLVVVRFRDSGPGVARTEELFRPFQTGAQSHGLGLYISRAILRAHGGDLLCESAEKGACFAVELWPVEEAAEV